MTFAKIWNLDDLAIWTVAGSHAKPRLEFSVSDPDTGDSIASLRLRVYDDATLTVGHTLVDVTLTPAQIALGYYDAAITMPNSNQANSTRWWTLLATDSRGEASLESTRTPFQVCWGQSMFQNAMTGGTASSGWDFSNAGLPAGTTAAFMFRTATLVNAGGTLSAWAKDIGDLVPNAYLNVLVRLSTYTSGTNATLNDMTTTYAATVNTPDKWTVDTPANWTIDGGAYRYGTKSFRFNVGSNSLDRYCYPYRVATGDDVVVQKNTHYVLSAFVKTNGALAAGSDVRLEVYRGGAGGSLIVGGVTTPDLLDAGVGATANSNVALPTTSQGWQRIHVHFITDSSTTLIRPRLTYHNGGSGINDYGWTDAWRLEEGDVVSQWSPSFISPAMILDAYGIFIDGMSGATFRIRDSAGNVRNLDDIAAGATYGPVAAGVQPYGTALTGVSPNASHADHEHMALIRAVNTTGSGGRLVLDSGYVGGGGVNVDVVGASAAAEIFRFYRSGVAFAQFRTDDTKQVPANLTHVAAGVAGTSDYFASADHKHDVGDALHYYDVRDFGAVGGGANDTTACQNALNAAEAAGGGTVFFPFMCSLSAFLTVASNVRVLGAGWNAGLTPLASFTTPTYLMVNKNYATAVMNDHDIIVENMVFDYTPATTSSGGWHALEIRWARRIRVRNCRFVMDACGDAIAGLHVDDFVVDGCTALDFRNCAWDFWTDPTDVTVTNCWAETSLTNQMFNFNPEGSPGNDGTIALGFTLTNCTFSYTGTGSIGSVVGPLRTGTQYGRDILIANNRFINCFITCRGATRNVVISGNTFTSVDGAAPVLSTVWNSQTPDGIVVMGNHVRACVNGTNGWIRIEGVNAIAMGNSGVGGDNSVPLVYFGSGSPVLIGNNSDLDTALRHRLNDRLSISSTITTHDDLDVSNTGSNGVSIKLTGDGATTPSKWIRVKAGILDILNSAFTIVVATLTDAGTFSVRGRVMPGDVAFGIQATGGMWHATGVPANANGNNNDWCISDNGHLYFRTAGAWVQKI